MAIRRTGFAAAAAPIVLALIAPAAMAAQGDLDTSFSEDGKLTLAVGGDGGRANAVVVDAKGRTLIAGEIDPAGAAAEDFAVARFLADGSADPAFSGDGIATLDASPLAGGADEATAIALQPGGKIVIAGRATTAAGTDIAVAALLPTGAVDTQFGGGDGIVTADVGGGDDGAADLAIDSSARIVVAGEDAAERNFAVARFTAAGAPDAGFSGPDGILSLNIDEAPSDDAATGVGIDSKGRIVLAGSTRPAGGADPAQLDFAVARLTDAGAIDPKFNEAGAIDGRTIIDASAALLEDRAGGLTIGGKDRPIVAGSARAGGDLDAVALRLTSAGVLDTTFSGDGRAFADLGPGDDLITGVVVDREKRIAIGGSYEPPTGDAEFELVRFIAKGEADTAFGGDGLASADIAPGPDHAVGLGFNMVNGRLILAGYNGPLAQAQPAVARFEGAARCSGRIPTIIGDPGTNNLKGTKRKDVISVGGGKDFVRGRGKRDVICGGPGGDRLAGGKGPDKLLGGKGRDILVGGPGKDRLKGGKGKDYFDK